MKRFTRFLRTPKGLLTIVLAATGAIAAPVEGLRLTTPLLFWTVAAAALVDAPILRLRKHAWEFPSGAVLTALLIAMVLSPHEPPYVGACTAIIAVLSKYAFRFRTANIFNPAALGLVVSFYLFDTGQSWWGAVPDAPWVAIALMAAGGIFIASRVNKMPFMLVFLGVYAGLFTLAAFAGPPEHVAEMFRPPDVNAVLFFACFILTDPPTSPTRYADQVICGTIVAVTSFGLFELVGAAYYLLGGVLVGNVWEFCRRWRAHSSRSRLPRRAATPVQVPAVD